MKKLLTIALFATLPVSLIAFSTGPPIKRTGNAVDGGLDCSACHRTYAPANSDARGGVSIVTNAYTPGAKQLVLVTVSHPEARRYGFQLTARLASDPTKQAGSFSASSFIRVRCDPTGDAPCPQDALQFAEHASAPFSDPGSYTFQVEWTPPAADAGDIVFYAAGNAANGDGTLNGDRIYTTSRTVSTAVCNLTAMPTIASVVNAASFQPTGAPNGMLTIFGTGFQASGSGVVAGAADLLGGVFPKTLGCVAVEVNGIRTPLTYIGANQINVQAPALVVTGPVTVRVIANAGRPNERASGTANLTVQPVAPGLFTFDGKSAAAQFAGRADVVGRPSVVNGGAPAKPGDIVTLYGTGFGYTEPVWQPGEIPNSLAPLPGTLTVTIGTATLAASDVLYAGLAPGSISALYQFNVRIPANAPDGDLPVVIQLGGQKTQNGVTVPVQK